MGYHMHVLKQYRAARLVCAAVVFGIGMVLLPVAFAGESGGGGASPLSSALPAGGGEENVWAGGLLSPDLASDAMGGGPVRPYGEVVSEIRAALFDDAGEGTWLYEVNVESVDQGVIELQTHLGESVDFRVRFRNSFDDLDPIIIDSEIVLEYVEILEGTMERVGGDGSIEVTAGLEVFSVVDGASVRLAALLQPIRLGIASEDSPLLLGPGGEVDGVGGLSEKAYRGGAEGAAWPVGPVTNLPFNLPPGFCPWPTQSVSIGYEVPCNAALPYGPGNICCVPTIALTPCMLSGRATYWQAIRNAQQALALCLAQVAADRTACFGLCVAVGVAGAALGPKGYAIGAGGCGILCEMAASRGRDICRLAYSFALSNALQQLGHDLLICNFPAGGVPGGPAAPRVPFRYGAPPSQGAPAHWGPVAPNLP